ncbi:hypothetical protein FQA39_LY09204 [Lamprigera yunnana]|nr:hypothetical protein FQA39_LY09204 [Lamprigera yunnana]
MDWGVSQTTSPLPRVDAVTASRSDKCSQTVVDVRNISAQTHSSPTMNKLAGSNLIKMRKKHDVACNKKRNSIQNVTNKSLFEELKEILPPIQINHDLTSPASVSSIHVLQKKSSAQKTTPRILILADSHGRNLANKFRDRLSPNYSVLCIFKPNATFEQTTCDLLGLTLDFNKGDHVIIMAETNDALVKNYISDNSTEKTVAELSHTNCLFVAVPYVYHCNYKYFNNLAYKTNYQFQFITNNYSESVKFVDVNRFLGSRHKTLNGLHLNDKGMAKTPHGVPYYALNALISTRQSRPKMGLTLPNFQKIKKNSVHQNLTLIFVGLHGKI